MQKMTDNDIMKALEMCIPIEHNCSLCPLSEEIYCCNHLLHEVFDLYNRQKAEVERLRGIADNLREARATAYSNGFEIGTAKAKTEAIKEIADSLQSILDEHTLQNGDVHFVALYKAVEKLTKELTE